MKNKLLTLFLALAASVGTLFAYTDYGTCGTNLTWTLNNGTLTISGTGAMTDYTYTSKAPWYSYSTSIKTVIIEDGVTSVGGCAFYDCSSLTSITIPNSVTSIGYATFSSCSSLTSVTIPNSVTSFGEDAFSYCSSLTSIKIPSNITSIGHYAFRECSGLTSIKIPNSIVGVGLGVFYGCSSLMSVEIPNGITYIAYSAFFGCTSLTSITIPNSVTSIGNGAFGGCSKISTITVYAEAPPTTVENTFENVPVSDITLYVPQQWIPLYKYDPTWKQFNIQGIDATDLKYTVTWKNYDGSVLETDENVTAGTIPVYNGTTPVKPADEQYTYTFAGWSPSVTTVTGETTYIATFTATFKANTYTIHVNQDCTSYMEEQQ